MPIPESKWKWKFVFFYFFIWGLPEVQNWFWMQFFNQVLYYYYLKVFLWIISSKTIAFQKMDFPLYFQNVIWPGQGFFLSKRKSDKAKHPKICLKIGGSMPKAQIKRYPLTPSPIIERVLTHLYLSLLSNSIGGKNY